MDIGLYGKFPINKILPDASNYVGKYGEIVIDLTLPGIRVMDGCCCGGILQQVMELTDCMKNKEQAAQVKARAEAEAEVAKTTTVLKSKG